MKTIYIARHAEAVSIGVNGVYSDFDRYLTEAGRAQLARQAKGLKQLEPRLEACFASPLVRARETAEALTSPYGIAVTTHEALGSRPDLAGVKALLAESKASRILLVTHQPFVVQLLSWLLTGDSEVNSHFGTATLACMHLHLLDPAPRGELQWLLPADMLAKLGG